MCVCGGTLSNLEALLLRSDQFQPFFAWRESFVDNCNPSPPPQISRCVQLGGLKISILAQWLCLCFVLASSPGVLLPTVGTHGSDTMAL